MNAEIIAIGSELLTPYRTDTNSLFLTDHLNRVGVEVVYKTIVGDDRNRLTTTLSQAWSRSDLVLTIGGLGPTEDDLTRECVSAALGRPLHQDDSVVEAVEARFRSRGLKMPAINLRQAMILEDAVVLKNPNGTAPGQWLEDQGKVLILLPGPPRELCPMFEESCLPRLLLRVPPRVICTRVLRLTGLTESGTEELAAPIYTRYSNPVTTILASLGEIQIHLRSSGRDEAEGKAPLEELATRLENALGKYVFSNCDQSLEEVVGTCLREREMTLAVAESCTGGMLAQRITSVSGSSTYFLGGQVCYSNSLKLDWLEVSPAVLETKGAVSPEIAESLAEGIRRKTGSTLGVGITGIAGPTGGNAEKPVGLVYLALAGPEKTSALERRFPGDREAIRWQATQAAMDMIRRTLLGL